MEGDVAPLARDGGDYEGKWPRSGWTEDGIVLRYATAGLEDDHEDFGRQTEDGEEAADQRPLGDHWSVEGAIYIIFISLYT